MKKTYIILTFLLSIMAMSIPYLGNILMSLNTMFHELGHALMTIITGGEVQKIKLHMDTSGVTHSLSDGGFFSGLLTSLGGYLFTPLVAVFFILLWKKDWQKFSTILLFISVLVTTVLFVRNIYGVIWGLLFLVLLFFIIKKLKVDKLRWVNIFIINLIISSSLYSSFVIFMLSLQKPSEAGDAKNLELITHIPAFVWGTVFLIGNIIVIFYAFKILFQKTALKGKNLKLQEI